MSGNLPNELRRRRRRHVRVRCATIVAAALALLGPGAAVASRGMALGIFDDASTLDAAKAKTTFSTLESLHVQVVRMTLQWGGPGGVANKRPAHPADPADP